MTLIRACPKCKSEHFIKNGKLHARQRYECKACGYNFTVSKLGKSKPPEVRRMALQLYLEGLSLRGIERLLKISHVTVLKWVRQWGKAKERLRREAEPKEVRQVEIDELCSYIGEKKSKSGYGWVWIESGGKCWILWWETGVSGREEDFMNA
jgi:transposase